MHASKSKRFNGHPSWDYWNVSLWINSDEGLYRLMRQAIKETKRRRDAAMRFVDELTMAGITKTPDGAPYSQRAVLHAMKGVEK